MNSVKQSINFIKLVILLVFSSIVFIQPTLALNSKENQKDIRNNPLTYENEQEEIPFDPDDIPPLTFNVTNELSFGAKLNLKFELFENEDLQHKETDDITEFQTRFSIAMLYLPTQNLSLLLEGQFEYSTPLEDFANLEDRETEMDLKRGYILWEDVFIPSLDIQLGRARIKDKREWVLDKNLDAIRIGYEIGRFSIDLSGSTNIIDPKNSRDRIINYYLKTSYKYGKKSKISLYGLLRRDNSDKNFNPSYIGLSLRERSIKRQKIWLNTAFVLGHDDDKRLRGYGVDFGWVSRFRYFLKPYFTLGFAFGSGDSKEEANSGVDRNFRQTKLHDNNAKYDGETKFKYYGEVFDPELSNMMIWTAGLGIKPFDDTSIDVVYHRYAQVERSDKLRNTSIDPDPTGRSKDLGQEVDLIIGTEISDNIEVSLTGGVFLPGNAFPNDEDDVALFGEIKFQIAF